MGKEQELFSYSFVIFMFVSSHLVQSQYQPRIVGTTEYDLRLYLNRSLPTTLAPTTIAAPTTASPVANTATTSIGPNTGTTKTTTPPVPNTATGGTTNTKESTATMESNGPTTEAASTSSNNAETTATVSSSEQPAATTEDVTITSQSQVFRRRRLLSLDTGTLATLGENLTIQLGEAFKDVTGYDKVYIETIKETKMESNFQIMRVNYSVSFDAQKVSRCLSNKSCDFAEQMKKALDRTAKLPLEGDTVVDEARTQQSSTEFIQRENSPAGRLVNQCTAFLPCLIHGPQVTCNYKENVTCKNVCEPPNVEKGYCGGGICQANDTVLNGVKMCSCPFHTFHNNWECLSWWILLGPIIGAGALLIFFLILMCVLCVRLRKRKEDEHLRKLYSGKDSLDRYHSEGNDNTGYMPEPVSLARYDNIELANGQANKEPQTFTAPADKPSENTRSSLRREEPPTVETKQEMRELRREPIQSEYRPLVEEKAPLAYHHQDDTPEPRRSMYDKNWEQELAKQYDSRDFNLQNVPQDKFQFNRPKVVRPGQASFGDSAPVARF